MARRGGGASRPVLNMASQIAVQVAAFISGLLVPGFIIAVYGSEINGISSTVNQIISYTALLEAGLGLVSIQALYKPLAAGDMDGVSGVCSATSAFYRRTALWFSLVILVAAAVYPQLARGQTDRRTIALLVLTISSTSVIEYVFHAKYRVLLTADQRLYVVGFSQAIGMVLQTVVKLWLIGLHVHVVLVYAISALTLAGRLLFVRWYVRRRYPAVRFDGARNDGALSQRGAMLRHQIAGLVVNNTDGLIISTLLEGGLKLASVLSVYSLVFKNMYNMITGAFSGGVVASFGRLLNKKEMREVVPVFRMYETAYMMVISVLYGTTAVMLLPFVGLYTRGVTDVVYVRQGLAVLFLCAQVLNATRVPYGMMINAAGHFRQTQGRALLEAGIHLGVSLALVFPLGMEGVVVASLCSYGYRAPDQVLYTNRRILGERAGGSVRRVLLCWGCIAGCAVGIPALLPVVATSYGLWLRWAAVSFGLCCAVTLVVFGLFERRDLLRLLRYARPGVSRHGDS